MCGHGCHGCGGPSTRRTTHRIGGPVGLVGMRGGWAVGGIPGNSTYNGAVLWQPATGTVREVKDVEPMSTDGRGSVVGMTLSPDQRRMLPVLIRDGRPTLLPVPAGALAGHAEAISTGGVIAGTVQLPSGKFVQVTWHGC